METVGARFMELADQYLQAFPVSLGNYQVKFFDRWAFKLRDASLRLPKIASSTGDEGWGTHLQNRHNLKHKVNAGGRCLVREPEVMFQIESRSVSWRTVPIVSHTSNLARSLSERSRKTLDTRLRALYRITDESANFPLPIQETFDRIALFIGYAQGNYDNAGVQLTRMLNDSFAEIKAHLLRLKADGEDIRECVRILKLSGIELVDPLPLTKPKQLR